MNKEEIARLARKNEIDSFAFEMQNTVPTYEKHNIVEDSDNIDVENTVEDDIVINYVDNNFNYNSEIEQKSSLHGFDKKREHESINNVEVDIFDDLAVKRKIPLSHQVDLTGHTKAVTCLSFEPSGNRISSGSLDYGVKLFDFGGMDSRHRSFKSIEAQDNHPVVSISHSSTGDKFIVGTGSCQPKVFDREGVEIITFARGDMYLRDLSNTKGHTMEVTTVQWHPTEKHILLTSSLDGTLRIWDLTGTALFGKLINKHVLKVRALKGTNRVGATSCCYSSTGSKMIAGCSDGSIHIWNERQAYSKADIILRGGHGDDVKITSVTITKNDKTLISRDENGTVAVWDLKTPKAPRKIITGLNNIYPTANIELSPDDTLFCCGISSPSITGEEISKSLLIFFEVAGSAITPVLQVGVSGGASAIFVKWQPNTNQIFCSTSTGGIKVFYDPRMSKKGALLTATKAPRRAKDPADFATGIGEILNPNALPMYREESSIKRKKVEQKQAVKSMIPTQKLDKGPGSKDNTSFFFTKMVTEGRTINNSRTEDPRAALLKFDEQTKSDPMFLGRSYLANQPKTQFHHQTFEQEQEEFKKKQKDLLK